MGCTHEDSRVHQIWCHLGNRATFVSGMELLMVRLLVANQTSFVWAVSVHGHCIRRVTAGRRHNSRPWGKGLASARLFQLTSPFFEDHGDPSHGSPSKQDPKEPWTGGQSLGEEEDVVWSLGWAAISAV